MRPNVSWWRIALVAGWLAGVPVLACARFSGEDGPAAPNDGGTAETSPPGPTPTTPPGSDAAEDTGGDGRPGPGDGGKPASLIEGFDNGCGMWAPPTTTPLPETKPRTIGACRVCPGSGPATLRGTFTTPGGTSIAASVWIRAWSADGQMAPGTVVGKMDIPLTTGQTMKAESMETSTSGWKELQILAVPAGQAAGQQATLSFELTDATLCFSVDDLVVR